MEIEAVASRGTGKLSVTGIVEVEEIEDGRGHTMHRTSTAKAALINALMRLKQIGLDVDHCDMHVNFPGGIPVDGPSAGIAMAVACYSAIAGVPVAQDIAMTGEISANGRVLPVGGVSEKIEAARKAGLGRVLIPIGNDQERYRSFDIEVVAIDSLEMALLHALSEGKTVRNSVSAEVIGPVAAAK